MCGRQLRKGRKRPRADPLPRPRPRIAGGNETLRPECGDDRAHRPKRIGSIPLQHARKRYGRYSRRLARAVRTGRAVDRSRQRAGKTVQPVRRTDGIMDGSIASASCSIQATPVARGCRAAVDRICFENSAAERTRPARPMDAWARVSSLKYRTSRPAGSQSNSNRNTARAYPGKPRESGQSRHRRQPDVKTNSARIRKTKSSGDNP